MTTFTATYSPDDNKLRLYASTRLDQATYERVKAAGFRWAPKQDLFFAPMWTPDREDLLIELAGDIGDEDTSLTARAEQRAERFEGYSERRADDAERARKGVAAIADNIPLGQPILVGHHSERHARKDAERIENGMRKAVKMWQTSKYWTDRAAGALAHASYKELPQVRARRIKTIETDQRRNAKNTADALTFLKLWREIDNPPHWDGTPEALKRRAMNVANHDHVTACFPLDRYPRPEGCTSVYEGSQSLWGALDNGTITPHQAQGIAVRVHERGNLHRARWAEHYENRLAYERAMLAESGYTPPPKPKTKADLPLLNYPGEVAYRNPYQRGEIIRSQARGITKAELAQVHSDYKGTRVSECGTHRVRTAYISVNGGQRELCALFLTDSKQHPRPTTYEKAVAAADEKAAAEKAGEAAYQRALEREARASEVVTPPNEEAFKAIQDTLRQTMKAGGVQIVTAPQLFPTPPELARQMVDRADIWPGQRVLEPSAGTGALLSEIVAQFCGDGEAVAVEINFKLAEALRVQHRQRVNSIKANAENVDVRCSDFLSCNGDLGTFDRIVMNPPFSNGADVKHITHALTFLKPGGRLVALCANGPRQQAALQPIATEWEDLPEGSFKEAGTNVNVALLVIDKD